jgi:hypothetical protein
MTRFPWVVKRPWRYTVGTLAMALVGAIAFFLAPPLFATFMVAPCTALLCAIHQSACDDQHKRWVAYGEKTSADNAYLDWVDGVDD